MNFDQLVTFANVAKTKNFSLTAESLHLSQPSVTNRIKNLEDGLGVPLFNRTSKNLELTRAGEKLLDYSNRIIQLVHSARMEIGRVTDEIKIGATPTLGNYILPQIVGTLHSKDGKRNFVIKQGLTFHLLNQVISGNIDMALVLQRIEHPDIFVKPLKETLSIVLVASEGHPLASQESVTRSDLANYKMVSNNTKGGFWKLVGDQMVQHNLLMESFVQVDSVDTAKQLLRKTVSLSFMPHQAVTKELDDGLLHQIRIEDVPPFDFPIYLICHKSLLDSTLIKQLEELLLNNDE